MSEYEESLVVLLRCESKLNTYDLQVLLGELYLVLQNLTEAQKHYREAAFMCPNRFMPLYKLVVIADKTLMPEEGDRIAREIIHKKVKIPSAKVLQIKAKMYQRLKSIDGLRQDSLSESTASTDCYLRLSNP